MKKLVLLGLFLLIVSFGFSANVRPKRLFLAWEKSEESDLNYYKIYRKVGLENFRLVGMTESVQFLDTNISENTTYTYAVSAVDTSANESTRSLEVVFTNADVVAPAVIRVTGVTQQNDVYVGISVTKP